MDFLPQEALEVPRRLGMTFALGKKADEADGRWERDLEADLQRLREGLFEMELKAEGDSGEEN